MESRVIQPKTLRIAVLLCCLVLPVCGVAVAGPATGPLRVHPDNPRYFADGSGRAILLTGSHTWNNLVDMGPTDPPASFDYDAHLDWLEAHHHNFFRLWAWELLSWDTRGNREKKALEHHVSPHPWRRTGPGTACDGRPRFDLTQFNEIYFARLRERVAAAQARGIYAAVMLFEGWGIQFSPGAWPKHPFHPANNVNGINGDLNGDGTGLEIHTGKDREVTGLQQAYVRRVIDTVNTFDNVLYEISNENHPPSTEWQYDMIRFIKDVEARMPKQHPVGMTFQYKGGRNKTLFESPADWVSPNNEGGYRDNPPAADGSKVIVTDTDHLWGIGGNAAWVWMSFLRGLNPIFMDPYDGKVLSKGFSETTAERIRKAMGHAFDWSRRVDLARLVPRPDLASSKHCLANPGVEYLVYVSAGGKTVEVTLEKGRYLAVWFDTGSGKESPPANVNHAGGKRALKAPFGGDVLLHLRADGG